MRRAAVLAALLLAGCAGASSKPEPVASLPTAPVFKPAPGPVATAPPPINLPAAPVYAPPPKPPDQCGAYELAGLVGKPRTEIPIPLDPSRRRVVCSTCPVTQDFRPDRLTIVYDTTTGKVTKVGCY